MVEVYFKNAPIMILVAECESGMRHYDSNGKVLVGYVDRADKGLFQINTRYHLKKSKELGYDIFTPMGNIKYADYLFRTLLVRVTY